MLTCKAKKHFSFVQGATSITAHHLKKRLVAVSKSLRRDMGAQSGLCGRFVSALRGPFDFSEGPKRQSKNDHGGNAGILTEAEGKVAVALTVVNRQRIFQVQARSNKVSLKPTC